MSQLPQLRRDLREVENELRLATNRLAHYQTLSETALATDTQRVVQGLDALRETLRQRVQQPPS